MVHQSSSLHTSLLVEPTERTHVTDEFYIGAITTWIVTRELEGRSCKLLLRLSSCIAWLPITSVAVWLWVSCAAVLEESAELPAAGTAYDKNVSFFDSISCEALDRRGAEQQQNPGNTHDEKGRRIGQRQQNRALDVDTFGDGAAHYNPRHVGGRRGGRGRGRGFSRGGGQGRGGRGGGGNQRNWTQRSKPQEVQS